jgi:hypothetical protein
LPSPVGCTALCWHSNLIGCSRFVTARVGCLRRAHRRPVRMLRTTLLNAALAHAVRFGLLCGRRRLPAAAGRCDDAMRHHAKSGNIGSQYRFVIGRSDPGGAHPPTPRRPDHKSLQAEATTCRDPGSVDCPGFFFVAVNPVKKLFEACGSQVTVLRFIRSPATYKFLHRCPKLNVNPRSLGLAVDCFV